MQAQFPAQWRKYFPHTQTQVYLNHAAISPLSTPVMTALQDYLNERHLTKIENFFDFLPKLTQTKEAFARLLNCQWNELAYCPNTSSGFNLLANSYPWQAGDRILLNDQEFPSNVYPFMNLKKQGVIIDIVKSKDGYINIEDLKAAITPQTKLLSISHVQFLSGQLMKLETIGQLCKENGMNFSVDAIQSLGATSIDVDKCNIDFLACGSHKWLMAPAGIGFAYIRPQLMSQLTPAQVGWLSVQNEWDLLDYDLNLRLDASQFETGTLNFLGICGLSAALGVFEEVGMPQITSHILTLSQFLIEEFSNMGLKVITPSTNTEHLGIVTCEYSDATPLYDKLMNHQIECSVREEKYFRVAPHFYNTIEELEILIQHMKSFMR